MDGFMVALIAVAGTYLVATVLYIVWQVVREKNKPTPKVTQISRRRRVSSNEKG